MNFFEFLLQTPGTTADAAAPAAGNSTLSMLGSFVPILLLIVVFYFLLIRPQSKKQKALDAMIKGVKKGDRVVTIGGVHGTVLEAKEGEPTLILKVDDNTKLKFSRSAVATVEKDDAKVVAAPEKKSETSDK